MRPLPGLKSVRGRKGALRLLALLVPVAATFCFWPAPAVSGPRNSERVSSQTLVQNPEFTPPARFPVPADCAPPDVFRRVEQLGLEVESLRRALGRPRVSTAPVAIRSARPREVYLEALGLESLARRLANDVDARPETRFDLSECGYRPRDVYRVIAVARDHVGRARNALLLEDAIPLPPRDPARKPSDVCLRIFQISRQISLLLDRPLQPRLVYAEVTAALELVSALRAQHGLDLALLPPPSCGFKRPQDVHARLLSCLDTTATIADRLGIEPMRVEAIEGVDEHFHSSDVFHLARLLVSQLEVFQSPADHDLVIARHLFPPTILPADVWARSCQIESALHEFVLHLEADAEELSPNDRSK